MEYFKLGRILVIGLPGRELSSLAIGIGHFKSVGEKVIEIRFLI